MLTLCVEFLRESVSSAYFFIFEVNRLHLPGAVNSAAATVLIRIHNQHRYFSVKSVFIIGI